MPLHCLVCVICCNGPLQHLQGHTIRCSCVVLAHLEPNFVPTHRVRERRVGFVASLRSWCIQTLYKLQGDMGYKSQRSEGLQWGYRGGELGCKEGRVGGVDLGVPQVSVRRTPSDAGQSLTQRTAPIVWSLALIGRSWPYDRGCPSCSAQPSTPETETSLRCAH